MKKLICLVFILLTSCGARKTAIEQVNSVKDSTAIVAVKTEKAERIDKENVTSILTELENEEIIVTPIDTSKVIIINGKVFKNVRISIKKNKASNKYTNTDKASEIRLIDSVATSIIKEKQVTVSKTKLTDKKEAIGINIVSYLLLLLLLIVIISIVRRALNR
tara:strand:+ start:969 stop:1457 length:489 start_codon:yes stop_codon:yes gene_type:complete